MKRGFTIWQFLLLIAVLFILAAIFFPVFARMRENAPKSSCQSNLKQIGLGFQQYLQDYDEKFPLVISGGAAFGWADALHPYIKSVQRYQCPSEQSNRAGGISPRAVGHTDYWMNSRLAGRNQKGLTATSLTILNSDGNDGTDATDARYALDSIPAEWISNKDSPLYRHLEGANYGFTDGHVKWYQAEKMAALNPNASPKSGVPTFALK